jgi:hypothetical protein
MCFPVCQIVNCFWAAWYPIIAVSKIQFSKKENSHDKLYKLTSVARQLVSFRGRYGQYLQKHTVNIADKTFQYLKGLFQADKKNLERIEERVPETKYDPL